MTEAISVGGTVDNDPVDQLEATRERLRGEAREAMGFTRAKGGEPLRAAIAKSGVGWYPLGALGLLGIVDQFQGYAFFVLAPEISRALGVSRTALAGITALGGVAGTLATLSIAAFVQKRARRAVVSIVTGIGWSMTTLFTALVRNVFGLGAVVVGDSITSASVSAVHTPLLVDSYPTSVRVRVLSAYRGAQGIGNIISPLTVAALTALVGLTWRGVFLSMGVASLAAALVSLGLRDPGFGKWDASGARQAVRRQAGQADGAGGELDDEAVTLGFFEVMRRLLLIPTIRRILVANAVLGMMLVPLYTYTFFFLDERWGMGPGARGLFSAAMPVFSIGALWAFGRSGEALFHQDPAKVVRLGAWFLGAGVVFLALAVFSPYFVVMVALYGVASALFAALGPALYATILSIIPPAMRPHASALSGIFFAGVGGFGGLVLLGGFDRRFGVVGAIASLALPGIAASVVFAGAARTVGADIDRMVDELVEDEELALMTAAGVRLPLLACRHLDFSYGTLQVLFDVSLDIEEGEMVALLGTNGAGKSTLLNVISGLGLPTKGRVRYRGGDITYLDAERRLRLGIGHVPGPSVFPPLSVVENLRIFGYSLGRDRAAVEAGVDAAFEGFPALQGRRDQAASTLSGGERQMLSLAKALMLKPRLLLIDELSLGLSPAVMGELLAIVRRINTAGTAVILVEQSVNVALSLAQRAYFLDRGRVRFDGPAPALLERKDLLRSVFLEGAAQGFGGP